MKKLFLFLTTLIISLSSLAQWNRAIGIGDRLVSSINKIDNYVFAATDSGAYRSSDGISWQLKIHGLDRTRLNTYVFHKSGDRLYAAGFTGVYVSTDYGAS